MFGCLSKAIGVESELTHWVLLAFVVLFRPECTFLIMIFTDFCIWSGTGLIIS